MCGRFAQYTSIQFLKKAYNLETPLPKWTPNYNIAPGEDVLVIFHAMQRKMALMQWGLVPFWMKTFKDAPKFINARLESVSEKPSFKKAFHRQRCTLLGDGFYEWKKEGRAKQPYYFTLPDRKPLAFAGIWDLWQQASTLYYSCAIITTPASEAVSKIHHRMPLILQPNAIDDWLNPNVIQTGQIFDIAAKGQVKDLVKHRVSRYVSHPGHKESKCIAPIAETMPAFKE